PASAGRRPHATQARHHACEGPAGVGADGRASRGPRAHCRVLPPAPWGCGALMDVGAVVVNFNAGAHLVDCVTSLREAGVDTVVPRIDELDGSLYPSARAFPRLGDAIGHAFLGLVTTANPYSRRYLLTDWDHATPRDVDWVSGACFLARRSVLEALSG